LQLRPAVEAWLTIFLTVGWGLRAILVLIGFLFQTFQYVFPLIVLPEM